MKWHRNERGEYISDNGRWKCRKRNSYKSKNPSLWGWDWSYIELTDDGRPNPAGEFANTRTLKDAKAGAEEMDRRYPKTQRGDAQ